MPVIDLPEDELRSYLGRTTPPPDLDTFWYETLDAARLKQQPPDVRKIDNGLRVVETYDVTLSGYDGDEIRAWYHRPAGSDEDLPVVVRYQGYGGGRGLAHQLSPWSLAGYACLEVDVRGQGSEWRPGHTADPHGSAPSHPGFLTRGLPDPRTYYYRRVYTDAVLALDALQWLPGIDHTRIAVTGTSQGGGISLAVAGLVPGISAVMADVPFLSDFRRAVEITPRPPYTELRGYLAVHRDLAEEVFRCLSYFDVSVLVRSATAPALFSVAFMDTICPPSTVYAAYNAYPAPKRIIDYPFNDHEGGQVYHEVEQLRWLQGVLTSPDSRGTGLS